MDRFGEPFQFPLDADEQVNADGDGEADLRYESSEQVHRYLLLSFLLLRGWM